MWWWWGPYLKASGGPSEQAVDLCAGMVGADESLEVMAVGASEHCTGNFLSQVAFKQQLSFVCKALLYWCL